MLLIAVSACKNNDEVILKGKFENAAGLQKVALYKGDQLVDSVILNENGEFKFAFISPETDFYYLSAAQKTYPLIAKTAIRSVLRLIFQMKQENMNFLAPMILKN